MKVFLDVGAHNGETLGVVISREWRFDRIVCFEPAPACWPSLESIVDERVEVCHFGLWKQDEVINLHNPGSIGASVATDKDKVDKVLPCDFRDASEWFASNLKTSDEVFVKINAEGAEVDIVGRLAATGDLATIDHLLIHFDLRKVPSLVHRETQLRGELDSSGVDWVADDIQFGWSSARNSELASMVSRKPDDEAPEIRTPRSTGASNTRVALPFEGMAFSA